MTEEEKCLVQGFFDSVAKLQDAGIVRSDKVLGDLAEWICVRQYGLVLETSGRHPGYDGLIGNRKVQVKAHNSPKGTNLNVGMPEKYDELFVLIGPRSRLRVGPPGRDFHVYRFAAAEVQATLRRVSGCYCARGALESRKYAIVDVSSATEDT